MKKSNLSKANPSILPLVERQPAEKKLGKQKAPATPATEADATRLLHELQVHQIELEMQNEQLVQARAEAEAVHRQFTELYDFAPVGYFTLTRDGTISQVNLTGATLLCAERSKLLTRRFGLFVAPAARPAFAAFLEKVFISGEKQTCEMELLCQDKTESFCVQIEAVSNDAREMCHAVVSDVSKRKQIEEALRETSKNLAHMFANSPTVIYALNVKGDQAIPVWVSSNIEKILGYTTDAPLQPDWWAEHIYPPDLSHSQVSLGHLFDDFYQHEYRFFHNDGRLLWLHDEHRLLRDADNKPHEIIGAWVDITERKQADEALRESNELLSLFIKNSPVYAFIKAVTPTESRNLSISDNFQDMLGIPASEMVGKTMAELFPADLATKMTADDWAVVSNGVVLRLDEDFNGRNYSTIKFPVVQGDKTLLAGYTIDITERKQAEDAMRREEETLRLAVDATADGIWDWDIQRNIEFFSPRWCEIIGYSYDDPELPHTYDSWASRIHPEDKDYVITALTNHLEKGFPYDVEYRHLHKSGEYRLQKSIGKAIHNENNKPVRMVGCIRDITESKRAEESLRESEEKFRSITEQTSDFIAITDARGIVTYVSSASEKLFQFAPEEMCGRNFIEFLDEPEIPRALAVFSDALKGGLGKHGVELSMKRKDGSIFIGELNGSKFQQGLMNGTLVVIRDITERMQAEEKIRQQSEQLRLLYEASQRLNQTLDRDEIHQALCEFMSANTPNDGFVISDFDPETQLIICRAFWMDNKWLDVSGFPPIPLEAEGKGTQSIAIRSGQPLLIRDFQEQVKTAQTSYSVNAETNAIESEVPAEEEDITRSALIVPLKLGGIVTGVIQVMSYRLNAFTENQLKLLEALALHIASAEQNAMLYARVQTELNERARAEEEIKKQLDELQRWNNATLGREMRVLEIKREVNELLGKAGQPPRYPSAES